MPQKRRGNGLVEQLFGTDGVFPLLKSSPPKRRHRRRQHRNQNKQVGLYSTIKRNWGLGLVSLAAIAATATTVILATSPRRETNVVPQTPSTRVSYGILPTLPPATESRLVDGTYINSEELTLENVKQTLFNRRFVQAYLNKILTSGKVPFRSTEVVYDPDGRITIEFLESQRFQFTEGSKERELIAQAIQIVKSHLDEINKYLKKETLPSNLNIAITYTNPPYSENKTFLFQIPHVVVTDDDLLWILYGAWCQNEASVTAENLVVPSSYAIYLPRVLRVPDVKDAVCYDKQVRQVQNGTFRVSRGVVNGILGPYTKVYNGLLAKHNGNDLESAIVRQILDTLIDPNNYKPPVEL